MSKKRALDQYAYRSQTIEDNIATLKRQRSEYITSLSQLIEREEQALRGLPYHHLTEFLDKYDDEDEPTSVVSKAEILRVLEGIPEVKDAKGLLEKCLSEGTPFLYGEFRVRPGTLRVLLETQGSVPAVLPRPLDVDWAWSTETLDGESCEENMDFVFDDPSLPHVRDFYLDQYTHTAKRCVALAGPDFKPRNMDPYEPRHVGWAAIKDFFVLLERIKK